MILLNVLEFRYFTYNTVNCPKDILNADQLTSKMILFKEV